MSRFTKVSLRKSYSENALKLINKGRAAYESYLEEIESYREEGFTHHYCEHGTNRWTDYDNICGGCEDGWSNGDIAGLNERSVYAAKHLDADTKALLAAHTLIMDQINDQVARDQLFQIILDAVYNLYTKYGVPVTDFRKSKKQLEAEAAVSV